MPVHATRFIRHMRGGAQAHLLEGGDGYCYVTKFRQNPQHHRILINEFIAARLLGHLRIATPKAELIRIDAPFLARERDVRIHTALGETPVEPGWHFGSRFPGQPDREAVYDYLPDQLLECVHNKDHFLGVLAFDKWTANTDSRQAIFVRQRIRELVDDAAAPPLKKGFVALMIDHGFLFDGPVWEFTDAPAQGFYFRGVVYREVSGLDAFEPWLTRIREAPVELFDEILRDLPREWLEGGDAEEVEALIERLYRRRAQVAELIAAGVAVRPSYFPRWGAKTAASGK
jgi:hypothetical protein